MKSLVALSISLLQDCQETCGFADPNDIKTIVDRTNTEGESFLTLTLPKLASDFEKSLSLGEFTLDSFTGFKRKNGLPLFLGGFLAKVFDRNGEIFPVPDITAIKVLRQFLLAFGKIKELASEQRCIAAVQQYVDTDDEIGSFVLPDTTEVELAFYLLFKEALSGPSGLQEEIETFSLLPQHGNGSVADRIRPNQRWHLSTWTDRLQSVFPYDRYATSGSDIQSRLENAQFQNPGEEHPIRVVLVPKTAKTPRVIAMEPVHNMYMQQALMRSLVPKLEKSCWGLVRFTDQSHNQSLALIGSYNNSLATLDLSEASDRVSLELVKNVTRRFPVFQEALLASRSRYAQLPDGSMRPIKKFASMGSAMCFPVEAMVFLAITMVGIAHARREPLSERLFKEMRGQVVVYGDDIIVPTYADQSVRTNLEAYGLKVNHNKSFSQGNFRESCGGDFYKAVPVTPVRLRSRAPRTLRDSHEFLSTVSTRNFFYAEGCYPRTVKFLDTWLDHIYSLPKVPVGSPVVGKWSFSGVSGTVRFNKDLHRFEIKTLRPSSYNDLDQIDSYSALLKFFTLRGSEPLGEEAYNHAGRARSVRLKTRWMPY